jgi:hypothetical protein
MNSADTSGGGASKGSDRVTIILARALGQLTDVGTAQTGSRRWQQPQTPQSRGLAAPPNLAAFSAADGAFAGAFDPDAARMNNSAIAAGKFAFERCMRGTSLTLITRFPVYSFKKYHF